MDFFHGIGLYFLAHPTFFLVLMSIFGLCIGSFLNVVIYRYPIWFKNRMCQECHEILEIKQHEQKETRFDLAWPASHCPSCKTPLKLWHNIPLLSYLLLRGKCGFCQSTISFRYPLVEFIAGLLTLIIACKFGPTMKMVSVMILTNGLIASAFIDMEHQYLPDDITLPLLWFGLLLNVTGTFAHLPYAVTGAIIGYMSLYVLAKVYMYLRKKEGVGYGDFKLFALFGAWLGWQSLPLILFLSSIIGLVYAAIYFKCINKAWSSTFAFGPAIIVGGLTTFLYGKQLLLWYFQLIGVN